MPRSGTAVRHFSRTTPSRFDQLVPARFARRMSCDFYFVVQASKPIGWRSICGLIHPACAVIRRISSIG